MRRPRGKSNCVEHNGQSMTLRDFADAVGLAHGTVSRRWAKCDRGERLARPADIRQVRDQQSKVMKSCAVNSLLAGWKLGTETGRSTSSAFAVLAANTP
jgi:hypothetical protein